MNELNVLLHRMYWLNTVSVGRCMHQGYCLRRIPRLVVNWEYIVHLVDFVCTDHFEGILAFPPTLYRLRMNSLVSVHRVV